MPGVSIPFGSGRLVNVCRNGATVALREPGLNPFWFRAIGEPRAKSRNEGLSPDGGLNPFWFRAIGESASAVTRREIEVSIPFGSGRLVNRLECRSSVRAVSIPFGSGRLVNRLVRRAADQEQWVSIPFGSGRLVNNVRFAKAARKMAVSIPFGSGRLVNETRIEALTAILDVSIPFGSGRLVNLATAIDVDLPRVSQSLLVQGDW